MPLTYLLVRGLPKPVAKELQAAAEAADLPRNRAVSAILRSRRDLAEAIYAGQRRAGEFAPPSRKKRVVDVGVHIPEEDYKALRDAAEGLSVKIRDAARFVLVGLSGSIADAIADGIAAKIGIEADD